MPVAAIGHVNAVTIWNALRANGATPVQAAGIMANMWFESNFNPEADAIDTNGKASVGLVQWNNNPTAAGLLTGNAINDIQAQVKYLASSGGFQAASGATPEAAAANFAHNYEKCAACGYQGGDSQLRGRASIAGPIYTAGTMSKWGPDAAKNAQSGSGGLNAILTGSDQNSNNQCYVKLPGVGIPFFGKIGGNCLFYESWGRAMFGGVLIASGGLMVVGGLALLVAVKEAPKILRVATPIGRAASVAGRFT